MRASSLTSALIASVLMLLGLAASSVPVEAREATKWTVLFDGTALKGWERVGTANWTLADGAVKADQGAGFLVTSGSYQNFRLRVEFWVSSDANSGVFIRCEDAKDVTPTNAYEVNIFDQRPDPSYGTGGITSVAKIERIYPVGGSWAVMEITAEGSHLTVTVNGRRTVDVQDSQHSRGRVGLQYGAGTVKFRKVEIQPIA